MSYFRILSVRSFPLTLKPFGLFFIGIAKIMIVSKSQNIFGKSGRNFSLPPLIY